MGQIAVTQAFMQLIRQAKGTVVFIASIGGRVASPFLSPYNASKFAVEALGESLRGRGRAMGHRRDGGGAGWIDTPIWAKGADTTAEQIEGLSDDARRLYGKQLARIGEVLTETADRGIHPDKVADVVHKAIASGKPSHRYLVGTDAKIAARLKGTLPDRTFHELAARRTKMPTDVPDK